MQSFRGQAGTLVRRGFFCAGVFRLSSHVWSVVLAGFVVAAAETPEARSPVGSEVEYGVDFWRTDQGLPHNTVNALLQTRDGYLWAGTSAGLARFDGFLFTVMGGESVPALDGERVTALLEDREGALWVGTQGSGVFRIRSGNVIRYTQSDSLTDDAVTSLAEDRTGTVWIATQAGLNKWEHGQLTSFVSDHLPAGEPIIALHAGRSGGLWITTRFEVFVVRDNEAMPFQFKEMPQGRNADFVGVYEDRSGNLWTYGATFLLNLSQGKRFNYFRSIDPASSRVWTICEQGEGAFWIGTSGRGIFRFHEGRFDIAGARAGLDQCDVRALYADDEGNLWIGTSGSGLARLRAQTWRVFEREDGVAPTRLTALALGEDGQLHVGTTDNGLMRLNENRLEPLLLGAPLDFATHIPSLCRDRGGSLWVGTWGFGLFEVKDGVCRSRYTTAEGLSDDVVFALASDSASDAVWAGTRSGGLHRISGNQVTSWTTADGLSGKPILCLRGGPDGSVLVGCEGGSLVRWQDGQLVRLVTPDAMRGHPVRCLGEDSGGRLWVGTAGSAAFVQSGRQWRAFGRRQGLPVDTVFQIFQDGMGNYWFGSEEGLFRVQRGEMAEWLDEKRGRVTALLSRRDPMPDGPHETIGWPTALKGPDGGLWISTSAGVLSVDPARIGEPSPLRVMIEKVVVDGTTLLSPILGNGVSELKVGPGVHSLDFSFTAVSFNALQETPFRHMLEGFDVDWVQSDTARRAHYGPVPPGRYVFRVIAANAEGVWSDTGARLSLVVTPPLWRSWWFLAACVLVFVALVVAVVRYVSLRRVKAQLHRSEQRRAMERERARIAQDMHDEIGSKLTRISFLSEAACSAVGDRSPEVPQVSAIADTSRELLQALDEIVWAVNPRNDNLEHLAGYLEQYACEYFQATHVECIITVPDELPNISLTAEIRHNVFLAFEEALSNVLQHAGATRVRIGMRLGAAVFEISVSDDGVGFQHRAKPVNSSGHDGLENMRNRLRAVGGACVVTSAPAEGTTVRLEFPLGTKAVKNGQLTN